jgi:hypothetical protein
MSIKFSISAVALATVVTLAHSAIASAEAYKSGPDKVVVTGLNVKQKYEVQAVTLKGKQSKKSGMTNTCGELLLRDTSKLKSLVVGTENIDIASLPTKTHARCNGKKNTTAKSSKQKTVETMSIPTTTTTPVQTTTTPATTTPATK